MFLNLEARKTMIEEMNIPDTKRCVNRCVLSGCREIRKKAETYSTHKILPRWLPIVKTAIGDPNWIPTEHSRICNLHFDPEDIRRSYRSNRLTFNAVPKHYLEPKEVVTTLHYSSKVQVLNSSTSSDTPTTIAPTTTTTTTSTPTYELASIPDTVDTTDFMDIYNDTDLESTHETKPIITSSYSLNKSQSSIKTSTSTVKNPVIKVENSKTSTISTVSSPLNNKHSYNKHSSSSLTVKHQLLQNRSVYQELEDYKVIVAQTLVKLKRQKRRIECLEALNRKLKLKVLTRSTTSIRSKRFKKPSGKIVNKKSNKS